MNVFLKDESNPCEPMYVLFRVNSTEALTSTSYASEDDKTSISTDGAEFPCRVVVMSKVTDPECLILYE